MNNAELKSRVEEILHFPLAGKMPDALVNQLCYWLNVRRGIIRPTKP